MPVFDPDCSNPTAQPVEHFSDLLSLVYLVNHNFRPSLLTRSRLRDQRSRRPRAAKTLRTILIFPHFFRRATYRNLCSRSSSILAPHPSAGRQPVHKPDG